MTRSAIPPQDYLLQCMEYDPKTGILRGIRRPVSHFKNSHMAAIWHAKALGREMGKLDREGYILVSLDGRRYRAHRLIWMMVHGEDLGPLDADHRNRIRSDNRLENLRRATRQQNSFNAGMKRNNTSGIKGVGRFRGAWRARIKVGGASLDLGTFPDKQSAAAAYAQAARIHHGDFANY